MNLPFDLEKAKAGHPLITRDCRKAKFIAYVPECTEGNRLIAHIEDSPSVNSFYDNGKHVNGSYDLFLYKPTTKIWLVTTWERDPEINRFYNSRTFKSYIDAESYLNNEVSRCSIHSKQYFFTLEGKEIDIPQ